MAYKSLSWYTIQELVFPIAISLLERLLLPIKKAPVPRVPIGKFEVTTSKFVMVVIMKSLTLKECMFHRCPLIFSACRCQLSYYLRSWRDTDCEWVIRWIHLLNQEVLSLPEHMNFPSVISGVRIDYFVYLHVFAFLATSRIST